MLRLRSRDLVAAVRFLATCDPAAGLRAFASSVTAALPALIPCDIAVFGMGNPRVGIEVVDNPHVTSAADLATYLRVSAHGPNPPLDHFARTGDVEARLLTDFVTRQQFHALQLYTDFYRPLRVEFMLAAIINKSPTAFDGITLNRTQRDFSERDRVLLTLVRPHIVQGYRTATAVDRCRADLALAAEALETPGFGLIVLSEGGRRMHVATLGAANLLTRYFGSRRRADELPENLGRWVRQHMEAGRDASVVPPVQAPFVVDRNGQHLVVRLVRLARDTVLMLEEPAVRADWHRIAPVGIGPREAHRLLACLREEIVTGSGARSSEIHQLGAPLRCAPPAQPSFDLTPHEKRLLGLLTEGHSYKTAAAVLGSSVHTVAFHVKSIFEKLQVHSKAEAVAKALRNGIVK